MSVNLNSKTFFLFPFFFLININSSFAGFNETRYNDKAGKENCSPVTGPASNYFDVCFYAATLFDFKASLGKEQIRAMVGRELSYLKIKVKKKLPIDTKIRVMFRNDTSAVPYYMNMEEDLVDVVVVASATASPVNQRVMFRSTLAENSSYVLPVALPLSSAGDSFFFMLRIQDFTDRNVYYGTSFTRVLPSRLTEYCSIKVTPYNVSQPKIRVSSGDVDSTFFNKNNEVKVSVEHAGPTPLKLSMVYDRSTSPIPLNPADVTLFIKTPSMAISKYTTPVVLTSNEWVKKTDEFGFYVHVKKQPVAGIYEIKYTVSCGGY